MCVYLAVQVVYGAGNHLEKPNVVVIRGTDIDGPTWYGHIDDLKLNQRLYDEAPAGVREKVVASRDLQVRWRKRI
jgi:hypothetical protein